MNSAYKEPLRDAAPISYAVLMLPPKSEMRSKGYDPKHIVIHGHEAHPLAVWQTHNLTPGSTYKKAVAAIQEINNKPWGLIRARLHFSDGSQEMFERTDPAVPTSLTNLGTYDPNDTYRRATVARATVNREAQKPRLKPIADDKGHHTSGKPIPRTFAPEVLFKNAPPPVQGKAGYDFTPMSYNSFLVKPNDPPVGVRPMQSSFMHSSCDYRPREFKSKNNSARGNESTNEKSPGVSSRHCHCAEVFQVGNHTIDLAKQSEVIDHRNRLIKKKTTTLGTTVSNSLVVDPRSTKTRGRVDAGSSARMASQTSQPVSHAANGMTEQAACVDGCEGEAVSGCGAMAAAALACDMASNTTTVQ